MNLLQDLREKLERLRDHPSSLGFSAVLRHIESAHHHYERGRVGPSDDPFNDAVYRTNQAYEGALKETWSVVGDHSDGFRTHELEKRLRDSDVLTERAHRLLESYRREWRNPSTHDHTLFFGEQDALLGIVSIMALTIVLIDQVVEHLAAEDQTAAGAAVAGTFEGDLVQRLIQSLVDYASSPSALVGEDGARRSEAEIMGRLGAALRGRLPDSYISREVALENGRRADFYLQEESDAVVLEVRRGPIHSTDIRAAQSQLLSYLGSHDDLTGAVLLVWPTFPGETMTTWADVFSDDGDRVERIMVVAPESALKDKL